MHPCLCWCGWHLGVFGGQPFLNQNMLTNTTPGVDFTPFRVGYCMLLLNPNMLTNTSWCIGTVMTLTKISLQLLGRCKSTGLTLLVLVRICFCLFLQLLVTSDGIVVVPLKIQNYSLIAYKLWVLLFMVAYLTVISCLKQLSYFKCFLTMVARRAALNVLYTTTVAYFMYLTGL